MEEAHIFLPNLSFAHSHRSFTGPTQQIPTFPSAAAKVLLLQARYPLIQITRSRRLAIASRCQRQQQQLQKMDHCCL